MLSENFLPTPPSCPTCGKQMRLTGHAPTCQSIIYDFSCSEDGDRLSWHRRDDARQKPLITGARFPAS
jgi:hypothetical protein